MAKNSCFWAKKCYFWPFFDTFSASNFPKFLWVVNIAIFEVRVSFYEIWYRGSGWKWPKIAFFGIKSCAKSRRPKIWPNEPYYPFSGFNWGVLAKIQLWYIFFLFEIFPREISDRLYKIKSVVHHLVDNNLGKKWKLTTSQALISIFPVLLCRIHSKSAVKKNKCHKPTDWRVW